MANPTFNIHDLVASVGRQPASPFQYPSAAQQNPARPAPAPRQVSDRSDLLTELGQDQATAFLQPGSAPSPTPTPTPVPPPTRRLHAP